MEPFIIWLEKSDRDELTHQLINNKNKIEKDLVLDTDDLLDYSQRLLEQNNYLLKLFLKLSPIKQNDVLNYHVRNKCESLKEKITNYHKAFNIKNNQSPNVEELLKCESCDVNKSSTLEDLDLVYKPK